MNRGDFLIPGLAAVALGAFAASEWITHPHVHDHKVHVVYWEKWTGFEFDAMKKVVDTFNTSQDKIQVDLLSISGIENKTLLAIAGGVPPDVAGLFGPNVQQYADDNALMPLDGYCRAAGIKSDQYIQGFWDIGVANGHVYALPSTPATTALHYNRALFRAAGLNPDDPPQTMEELSADAEKLTQKGPDGKISVSGFIPAEPGWWNWAWGEFFGGTLWDGKSKITIDSPENVRAFEWLQSFSKKYGPTDLQVFRSGFGTFSSPQNAFMEGKVAMEIQGVWMYNFITEYAPKLDWAAAPFPHPADRPDLADSAILDEDVLCIPRGAKHPAAAFQFIKFVQSQKGMEMLCLGQKKITPLVKVSNYFLEHHPNKYIQLFVQMAHTKHPIVTPHLGIWPQYSAEISNAFDEIVLMTKTPQEALAEVQARMQPKLDAYLKRMHERGLR